MEGTQESAIEFIELYKRKEIIRAFATIASRRNRILRALHIGVRSLSGSPSDVFAASSGFVQLYTLRFKKEREKSGDGGKGSCTQVGKCTAVQFCWQT